MQNSNNEKSHGLGGICGTTEFMVHGCNHVGGVPLALLPETLDDVQLGKLFPDLLCSYGISAGIGAIIRIGNNLGGSFWIKDPL